MAFCPQSCGTSQTTSSCRGVSLLCIGSHAEAWPRLSSPCVSNVSFICADYYMFHVIWHTFSYNVWYDYNGLEVVQMDTEDLDKRKAKAYLAFCQVSWHVFVPKDFPCWLRYGLVLTNGITVQDFNSYYDLTTKQAWRRFLVDLGASPFLGCQRVDVCFLCSSVWDLRYVSIIHHDRCHTEKVYDSRWVMGRFTARAISSTALWQHKGTGSDGQLYVGLS